jgi:hypothetical protein
MVKDKQSWITEGIMSNTVKEAWKAKRNDAIWHIIAGLAKVADKRDLGVSECDDDFDALSRATDVVAIAHVAAALEWERGSRKWQDQWERAMCRLVTAWAKYSRTGDDPEAEEELNIALDAVVVAHMALAFELARGPVKL